MLAEIELPTTLPVESLSLSAITLLRKCPLKYKRRYIDREYEPPSGAMLLGSAVGAAESTSYQLKVESCVDLPVDDVLDAFSDEWDERVRDSEDVDWGEHKPATFKDDGARVLPVYHSLIAPNVQPVSVEREFTLRFPGVDWSFRGYIDLEDDQGNVRDLKVKARKMSEADADSDPQPGAYLLARREEAKAGYGEPAAGFVFDTMIRTKQAQAVEVPTDRTDAQLDAFLHRIYAAAAEIAWRAETDVWDGAPSNAWWCGEKFCGHWPTCPLGGAR